MQLQFIHTFLVEENEGVGNVFKKLSNLFTAFDIALGIALTAHLFN